MTNATFQASLVASSPEKEPDTLEADPRHPNQWTPSSRSSPTLCCDIAAPLPNESDG